MNGKAKRHVMCLQEVADKVGNWGTLIHLDSWAKAITNAGRSSTNQYCQLVTSTAMHAGQQTRGKEVGERGYLYTADIKSSPA